MVYRVSKLDQHPCELFLIFDDLRAAERCYKKATAVGDGLTVYYLTSLEVGFHCPHILDEFSLNLFSGQVHLTAHFQESPSEEWDENILRRACEWLAGDFGEVRTFAEFGPGDNFKDYRVEFFKLSAARQFFDAYSKGKMLEVSLAFEPRPYTRLNSSLQGYLLTAKPYLPSCVQTPTPQPMSRVDSGIADMMGNLDISGLRFARSEPVATPQPVVPPSPQNQAPYGWFWSPTGRTRIPQASPIVPPKPTAIQYSQQGNLMNMNGQLPITPRSTSFPGVIGEPPQAFTPNSASWASSGDRDGSNVRFGPRGLRQDHSNGHHNTVNIDKIANGTDVRTTVSLSP